MDPSAPQLSFFVAVSGLTITQFKSVSWKKKKIFFFFPDFLFVPDLTPIFLIFLLFSLFFPTFPYFFPNFRTQKWEKVLHGIFFCESRRGGGELFCIF